MTKESHIKTLLSTTPVEWKKLGEVAKYTQPTKYITKNKVYNDSYKTPVLTPGKTFILGYTNETDNIYKASETPIILFDDFTTANKWVDFDFKIRSSATKIITAKNKNIALLKYIYYWLNTLPSGLVEGDHRRQWINIYAQKSIPIPPIPVQEEIVRTLDNFTQLTAELTAELTARKKQYEYYRDTLLTFGDKVEWKKLGEVAKYSSQRISADHLNKHNYIGVDNLLPNKKGKTTSNYVPEKGNFIKFNKNDILIGNIRPNLRKIWISNVIGGASNDVLAIKTTDKKISPRFLFQLLSSEDFFLYNIRNARGARMPRGDRQRIMHYSVPIPSLEEQARIVSILDKFDTLVNSISEGLPKEIQLRQKQYEYYRDLLLSFKK